MAICRGSNQTSGSCLAFVRGSHQEQVGRRLGTHLLTSCIGSACSKQTAAGTRCVTRGDASDAMVQSVMVSVALLFSECFPYFASNSYQRASVASFL